MDADSTFATNRLPPDTVFYTIYPDASPSLPSLQALHLQILQTLTPYTSSHIFHHHPFTLSVSTHPFPHLHGRLKYGDNLDDEWFTVFLLYQITKEFTNVSVRVYDCDGEFLLIEAADYLPRWLNPSSSTNRVFIRRGHLHIVPKKVFPKPPTLIEALNYLITSGEESRADEAIEKAIGVRIRDYAENVHRVTVRLPVAVAKVLKEENCLISLAVEGFYDRDIDSMKYGAKMERFLGDREMVRVSVRMTRAMYAQLVQQAFQAPKGYPMPARSDAAGYAEAELGMKIAVGLEMMYQVKKREGEEGKGGTWEVFRESLERCGYFEGLLPGSMEYRRLMVNAEEYYKKSSVFSRASEIMNAPVRRIDEILALPSSADEFTSEGLPPSDDDSWLYNGEDELNAALLEREKEMEAYNSKHKGKQKSKDQGNPTSSGKEDDFGLGEIAKSMQAFVQKMSSYEGAEVPENRNPEHVDFDVDRFMKDMESVMGCQGPEEAGSDDDFEGGSSSDMDFDESEEESDMEPSEMDEGQDSFMHSYSDAMNHELKSTTLDKSFVRAQEQSSKVDEGTSNVKADMDDEFTPVDVDVNLVKSFLDSFSSQEGLPGPATNLLGLMGLHLPQDKDDNKGK